MKAYIFYLMVITDVSNLTAQTADTIFTANTDTIFIETIHLLGQGLQIPYKISMIGQHDLPEGRQQLSLATDLANVPSLLVLNSNNFAQDLRLSVRGFGARAAFGIRGLRIFLDGLPESTPDGQGQVDNLDAGLISEIRMIGGPASAIYGNASGGIIQLESEPPPMQDFIEARFSAGSYRFNRYVLKAGAQTGLFKWIAFASHTSQEGYRDHSKVENTLVNAKIQRQFKETGLLEISFNYVYSPIAEDPGGLTREQFEKNPEQASSFNSIFSAGEEVEQGKVGLRWQQQLSSDIDMNVYGFYLIRDFINRLPFKSQGAVKLFRNFSGTGLQFKSSHKFLRRPYLMIVGCDLEWQKDHRRRFDNLQGSTGPLVFDQYEQFIAAGLFWLQEWSPIKDTWLMATLRYDYNHLSAEDKFLKNGDNSGSTSYKNLSPSFGLSYALQNNIYIYSNYSYSFETPALSELSSNPAALEGFNYQVKPQKAYNYEFGFKGRLESKLSYQATFFYVKLNNELVPYELIDSPGRSFYRNAGASERKGIETSLIWDTGEMIRGKFSYTFSNFHYSDYAVLGVQFGGQQLPGIPKHLISGQFTFNYSDIGSVNLQGRYLSRMYTDDANSNFSNSFLELSFRFQHKFSLKSNVYTIFGGVNNLLNKKYVDNIRLNAFAGRYFEAAPSINLFAGIQILLIN